jgi:hypothetical protein
MLFGILAVACIGGESGEFPSSVVSFPKMPALLLDYFSNLYNSLTIIPPAPVKRPLPKLFD